MYFGVALSAYSMESGWLSNSQLLNKNLLPLSIVLVQELTIHGPQSSWDDFDAFCRSG